MATLLAEYLTDLVQVVTIPVRVGSFAFFT